VDYQSEHHPQNVEARARRRVVGDLRALRAWCDRALALVDDPDPARVDYVPRELMALDQAHGLFTRGAAEWAALHLSMGHWTQALVAAHQRAEGKHRLVASGEEGKRTEDDRLREAGVVLLDDEPMAGGGA
jgi:hypothetical protein